MLPQHFDNHSHVYSITHYGSQYALCSLFQPYRLHIPPKNAQKTQVFMESPGFFAGKVRHGYAIL